MAPTSKTGGDKGKKPEKKEPVKDSSSDPKVPCPTCRRPIKKSKMKDHKEEHHNSSDEDGGTSLPAGRFGRATSGWTNRKCQICGENSRTYTSRETYNSHINSKHSELLRKLR
ncbi:hypothetical protein BELL_0542g00090 [Botrytis elliptica]|uniref:Uncharacterized protein n=1 Tax=Botrytis elliptica TaxID=278938 RepID=A0A4Z1JJM9_9HELO|nr:hypothetical protein BELL_0542g00090 [Botrytis elliptica]